MPNKKENSIRRTYSVSSNVLYVLNGIREFDKNLLFLTLISATCNAVQQYVPVLLPKLVVDELTGLGRPSIVILLVLIIGAVSLIFGSVSNISHITIQFRFINIRLRFIALLGQKKMTMDYQSLENPGVLDLSHRASRAGNDNQHGIEGVMHRLFSITTRLFMLTGCGVIIATLHPLMLIAIAILLATNFYITTRTRIINKKVTDALAPVERKVDYLVRVMRDFAYGKDIRLFGMKKFLTSKYAHELKHRLEGINKTKKNHLNSKNIHACTGMVQEVLLYSWVSWQVWHGWINISDYLMYIAAIHAFSNALGGLLNDISHIRLQNEVLSDYRFFLDYPDADTGEEPLPSDVVAHGGIFKFENVSFRYPGRTEYALQDVSIEIKPGERLAVVGLNGAGKTTFIKLLTRLYEPESGRILLNGVDTRLYDKQEYYKLFSVVFQDIRMFAFTVAENVSMKEYDKTDMTSVRSCLEQAGLGEKVLSLPKALDTVVLKVIEKDGIEFSGGESQKLALARALYKNAPIVVLDEPTSALDALAEERLYRQFDTMIGGKTAIYISHRLASTRFCDRVAMFDNGRIVEMGTHDELMEKGGQYSKVFAMQAKYYNEEVHSA